MEPSIPSDLDPAQLLRDLQSTLERESDLREQLKFAEEEVNNLRQKVIKVLSSETSYKELWDLFGFSHLYL